MSSTSETVKMKSLQLGSIVFCNWPNGHGNIKVIRGVVDSEPPLGQGAKVDIKFSDGNCGMKIVNRNSNKPGIVRADATTLRSTMEMKEIANRGRENIHGLELFVGGIYVAPNPLNASQLYAVKLVHFRQDGIVEAVYCCDESLMDPFKIDSIVRKLDDGEDPIKFLENVAAPNEEEEEEEEDVIEGPADNARDAHLAAQAQGQQIGDFWSRVVYKVRFGKRQLNGRVVETNGDEYFVRQCNVGNLEFKGKAWSLKARDIKTKNK